MLSKEEIKKWLLENCINEYGDLDLSGLDLSDFNGNVNISYMKVKKHLFQRTQTVGGDLSQDCQKVEGYLYQSFQEVKGNLWQNFQEVEGKIIQ